MNFTALKWDDLDNAFSHTEGTEFTARKEEKVIKLVMTETSLQHIVYTNYHLYITEKILLQLKEKDKKINNYSQLCKVYFILERVQL